MRNLLKKALRLPLHEKLFLCRCLFTIIVVRLGLTFSSYRVVRTWVPQVEPHAPSGYALWRVASAVPRLAKLVPGATCLTQALAGQILLARLGQGAAVHIGVAPKDGPGFEAHAWLVCHNRVVLGGGANDLTRFVPLTILEPSVR